MFAACLEPAETEWRCKHENFALPLTSSIDSTLSVFLADGRKASPTAGESAAEPPRRASKKGSWASFFAWLIVLGASLGYRIVTERQVAERELPRENDIFIVSYPKSGEGAFVVSGCLS